MGEKASRGSQPNFMQMIRVQFGETDSESRVTLDLSKKIVTNFTDALFRSDGEPHESSPIYSPCACTYKQGDASRQTILGD